MIVQKEKGYVTQCTLCASCKCKSGVFSLRGRFFSCLKFELNSLQSSAQIPSTPPARVRWLSVFCTHRRFEFRQFPLLRLQRFSHRCRLPPNRFFPLLQGVVLRIGAGFLAGGLRLLWRWLGVGFALRVRGGCGLPVFLKVRRQRRQIWVDEHFLHR